MNSDLIIESVYELYKIGIKVWIQNENIKVFVPDGVTFLDDYKKFIQFNRENIFSYLQENNLFSKDCDLPILKSQMAKQPLSFAQERLWFIDKYEEGTNAYNVPVIFKLSQDVRLDLLERSLHSMVNRHEILRTLIQEDAEGQGYQLVMDDKEYPLIINKKAVGSRAALDEEIRKEANHIYDLGKEYPIRVCILELANDTLISEYYLSLVIHHIAFDGWSFDILLKELREYYTYYLARSKREEASLDLPLLSIQYKDFALWQRHYMSGEKLKEQLRYWKEKLEGYEPLILVADKPRPKQINYAGADVFFEVDEETSTGLRVLAREVGVSLYSVLLSAYYLMLKVYSNQNDIIVGSLAANRHYYQIENLIGFFVNILILREKIDTDFSIRKFIKKIASGIIEAQFYQDLPLEKLINELEADKDTSRQPIFQVTFGMQSFGSGQISSEGPPQTTLSTLFQAYTPEKSVYNVAKFDISTLIDDSHFCLKGLFNYAQSLYTEDTIQRFVSTYVHILKQFSQVLYPYQTSLKIKDLTYLDYTQHHKIIEEWNATDQEYPKNKTLQALFEEQVERTPDNIAVVYEETKLTYRELNERANQLAHYLRQHYEIKPDTLIALCLDRSEYMLIVILGVLKAGGAYVPMDPEYPNERLDYILKDTATKIVLTNEIYNDKLNQLAELGNIRKEIDILGIDSAAIQNQLQQQSRENPQTTTASHNLAYVMYTSGTTGYPKGVMIEHSGVVNTVLSQAKNLKNQYKSDEKISIGHFINYVFDASVDNIFLAILFGKKLVISKKLSEENFSHIIRNQEINVAILPSAALNIIQPSRSLKVLFIGGETPANPLIKSLIKSKVAIFQEYGVTEASIVSFFAKLSLSSQVNILGKLIGNCKAYVLSSDLTPLPIGAIGELYIGGVGLARGYLNQPELTAERFIKNPFQTREEEKKRTNGRLYKTGDLVRWMSDGNLEFIGRNDFQVKIRGYRIELGEIERALSEYEGVKQCVVLAKEHQDMTGKATGNKYLAGYYAADRKLNEESILNYLQKKLPEYMVPTLLIYLEKIPLTSNGKLDRKALPEPEFTNHDQYVGPGTELEKKVAAIWEEVLGLPEGAVGIHDDFFRLGGNSILAIKLVNKVNTFYQSQLKISEIFIDRTFEKLISKIIRIKKNCHIIEKINISNAASNLFMIHPATAGCEVYNLLAHDLSDFYSCYGIDSFNMIYKNKIENLHELALHYLSHIDLIMQTTHHQPYNILGWSLGGQIALEIASILEARGEKRINLFLIDTVLYDENMLSLSQDLDLNNRQKTYEKNALLQGIEKDYIQKILSNMKIENKLVRYKISSELIYTKAILFKAMLTDLNFNTKFAKKIYKCLNKLKYNNIEKVFGLKNNLTLYSVTNANHFNIIDQRELLCDVIVRSLSFDFDNPAQKATC